MKIRELNNLIEDIRSQKKLPPLKGKNKPGKKLAKRQLRTALRARRQKENKGKATRSQGVTV